MFRLGLVLSVLFFVSCSSAKLLKSEPAEGVDFSKYKTFDFYKVEATGDTNSQKFNESIEKLQTAITIEMQKLGYLLSKTDPDVLVNIGVVVSEGVQTRQTDIRTDAPRYIGQRRYSWKSQEVEVGRYREGTVSMHLVDRKQDKMVYQSTVQDIVPQKNTRLEKTINKGVKKLFSGYPVSGAR